MVMFDSLNRRMLPPYGCDWTHAPNFARLAQRTVTFDNSYIGSMPCMPARRDLMTGRYNFLHRSWGPLEPFDDSLPELLQQGNIYSHLITDHQHYWEDGGATYHNRYSSYEFVRGQEGDRWKGHLGNPEAPEMLGKTTTNPFVRQDWINRSYIGAESDFPQAQSFALGMEFLERNSKEDGWFLQLETFDPHEPFHAAQAYRDLYPHDYNGPHFDWPAYGPVTETSEQVQHMRFEYAALLSMCDAYLGKVIDAMDRLHLWDDTMLIVNTDHGFLLGEHDEWAKCVQPFYNEVAHTPLFIWDPRSKKQGERRSSLVQLIDLAPTLLDYFGLPVPPDMQGKPLAATIARDTPVHETVLFGIHGGHVNITDGRYVYMRGPADATNQPLFNYTLMPTHMRQRFTPKELSAMCLVPPFAFTKGTQTLRIPGSGAQRSHILDSVLYDLSADPLQQKPTRDPQVEERLLAHMRTTMQQHDAPKEQYERIGIR